MPVTHDDTVTLCGGAIAVLHACCYDEMKKDVKPLLVLVMGWIGAEVRLVGGIWGVRGR